MTLAPLRALLTAEDDRFDILVAPQGPDHELGEIARVDELPERLARAGNGERGVILYGGSASQDGTISGPVQGGGKSSRELKGTHAWQGRCGG
jgi:hypothetical protein